MIPKKLFINGICLEAIDAYFTSLATGSNENDSDIFSRSEDSAFTLDGNDAYTAKDIADIKNCFRLLFDGSSAFSFGEIIFEYQWQENVWKLKRDFAKNELSLSQGDSTLTDKADILSSFENTFGMLPEQWLEESLLPEISASFSENEVDGVKVPSEEIDSLKKAISVLSDMEKLSAEELDKEIVAAQSHLDTVLAFYNENATGLGQSEVVQKALLLKEECLQALTKAQNQKLAGETLLEKSKLSHTARVKIAFWDRFHSLVCENNALAKKIEEGKLAIADREKEVSVGSRYLSGIQGDYLETINKIKALYTVLEEKAQDSTVAGKNAVLMEEIEKAVSKNTEQIVALQTQQEELLAKINQVDEDLSSHRKDYEEIHFGFDFKKAIRDFGIADAVLQENVALKNTFKAIKDVEEQSLASLKSLMDDNSDHYNKAKKKREDFLTGNNTPTTCQAEYNTLEQQKQELFRIQIVCAGILQELESIDKKIDTNLEANFALQENLDALENAKETLLQYNEKAKNTLSEYRRQMVLLQAQMHYLNDIAGLEAGGKCPVCDAEIKEKYDTDESVRDLQANIDEQANKIIETENIIAEYSAKLQKILNRIGALESRIADGKQYTESLQETKITKEARINTLYEQVGAKNQDDLSDKISDVIQKMSKIAMQLTGLNGFTATESIADENIQKLSAVIQLIDDENLEKEDELLSSLTKQAAAKQRQVDKMAAKLTGLSNEQWLDALYSAEEGEDAILSGIKDLLAKRKDLSEALRIVRTGLDDLLGRSYLFESKNGKYTFAELCVAFTGKQFSLILDEIHKEESSKQNLVEKVAATNRLLEEKKESLDTLKRDISIAEQKLIFNTDLLTVMESENPFADETWPTAESIEILKKDLMTEEEEKNVLHVYTELDKVILTEKAKCDILDSVIGDNVLSSVSVDSDKEKEVAAAREKLYALIKRKCVLELANGNIDFLQE